MLNSLFCSRHRSLQKKDERERKRSHNNSEAYIELDQSSDTSEKPNDELNSNPNDGLNEPNSNPREELDCESISSRSKICSLGFLKEALSLVTIPRRPHPGCDSDDNLDSSSIKDKSPKDSNKITTDRDSDDKGSYKYTHTDMLSAAIILCPLWFIANCSYNYALLYTSVGSSTGDPNPNPNPSPTFHPLTEP
jgi:hypothetical protein